MQNFQTVNQEQILKKLTGDFSAFQQGKEGKKLVYPVELRKKVRAAIVAGVVPKAAASACKVSVATIRSWTIGDKIQLVKRLEVEERESTSDFAVIYIGEQVRIQVPMSRLNAELLEEIIGVKL